MKTTVRQIVQDLVDGLTTTDQAAQALAEHTQWDRTPAATDEQRYAVHDIPPAGDNSPDQIDLVGFSLPHPDRRRLWNAATRAMRSATG